MNSVLELFLGDADDETVERIGHFDLTAQAAFLADVEGKVEHIFFHLLWRAGRLAPSLIDIDVTGGTGASPAALGSNAGDRILHRRLHNRHARFGLDDALSAVLLNKGNLGHDSGAIGRFRSWERGGGLSPY